jgi:hypothetical protein
MSAPLLCAYCRQRSVVPKWRPFCSERCKMTDLGRWLSGDYRVASTPASESGEPEVEPTSTDRDAH